MTYRTRALAVGCAAALLAACSGVPDPPRRSGIVTGAFLAVGGPSGATPSPQRGRIVVRRATGDLAKTVLVGQNGNYSFALQPGRYTLTGYSPQHDAGDRQGACPALHPITVRAGATTSMNAYCQRR